MPLIPVLLVLLIPFALILAIPIGLVQRYRLGKARRMARGWLALVNLLMIILSAAIFVWASALTNFWIPNAFKYSLLGLIGGTLLGLLGLALTKWEQTQRALHYTPNRWLVLALTLAVATRLLYGLWRVWHTWRTTGGESWLASAGVAGSIAIGAVVLGYYLSYSAGVYRRIKVQRRSWPHREH